MRAQKPAATRVNNASKRDAAGGQAGAALPQQGDYMAALLATTDEAMLRNEVRTIIDSLRERGLVDTPPPPDAHRTPIVRSTVISENEINVVERLVTAPPETGFSAARHLSMLRFFVIASASRDRATRERIEQRGWPADMRQQFYSAVPARLRAFLEGNYETRCDAASTASRHVWDIPSFVAELCAWYLVQ
jgi:hypothetical protein